MKTISEILGGGQAPLPLEYEVQDFFSELLSNNHRAFIHYLRVVENSNYQTAQDISLNLCYTTT